MDPRDWYSDDPFPQCVRRHSFSGQRSEHLCMVDYSRSESFFLGSGKKPVCGICTCPLGRGDGPRILLRKFLYPFDRPRKEEKNIDSPGGDWDTAFYCTPVEQPLWRSSTLVGPAFFRVYFSFLPEYEQVSAFPALFADDAGSVYAFSGVYGTCRG